MASGAVDRLFPIIGVGASAGGLEALERFLRAVPKDCGHAIVVVQHLDPTHATQLVELLQRCTPIPVVQVTDGLVVERDHVYVIPPNRDLSILQGVLHLMEQAAPRGLRLPIDGFLRALADDRREYGIGVILSGMGTDGTLGLRAIHERGGATFVQAPETAQFDGMPRSAIGAGLADVTAPPEELHPRILRFLEHGLPATEASPPGALEDPDSADVVGGISKVILLVRAATGHDFSRYKRSTLTRRIERRMGLHRIARIEDYIRFIQKDRAESTLLFNELLIGVTRFFRDPTAWDELADTALPALFAAHPEGGALRAWVAGCSSGEEAFSLAITFAEAVANAKPHRTLQIFATDLDAAAITKARAAVYPPNIVADVSEERLRRFFVEDERGYHVKKEIRETVIFAPQNLVMDPPFTKLDLLLCRNLLIYLTPALHKRLLPIFHHSLRRDGILMLGSAETVGPASDLFAPISERSRLYRRLEHPHALRPPVLPIDLPHPVTPLPSPERPTPSTPAADLQRLTDRLFLQRFAPAAVIVDSAGDILLLRGDTDRYLEPAANRAKARLAAVARSGIGPDLDAGIRRAAEEQRAVRLEHESSGPGARGRTTRVTIEPLSDAEAPRGALLVVFRDAPTDAPAMTEIEEKEAELEQARRQTQATQEELRSTNEELQSANEELLTSKEEMQSMNEELQTVNHELQAKLDELTLASNDMVNLLNSTSIATLFLDVDLMVRRFTVPTTEIIRLIPGDLGRPITDIVSALDFPDMPEIAREVLRTLVVFEREVAASGGRWFMVRIMPYRTHDDRIDGVVLTFTDVTKAKLLEAALRQAQSAMEGRLATQDAALGTGTNPKGSR